MCASFARISTLCEPFIEFITMDKTAPFSVIFAFRSVLHAPINRDKRDLAVNIIINYVLITVN